MTNIEKAKELLAADDVTCALCSGETVYTSRASGISPMMGFIEHKTELTGFSAADKIIGKAAAMLFILAGVTEVYGEVMSHAAAETLDEHNVHYSYGILTDVIVNRAGTGICPMEQTVENISDPAQAYVKLGERLRQLRGGS